MKLTFILPKWKHGLGDVRMFRMPPLGLLTLASETPEEWDVKIIDENVGEIKYEETDLVGISAMTPLANRAYKIADNYRSRGVKVIMGGIHASMKPEEAIRYVDSVVIGEADLIWPEILEDFKGGKLKRFYKVEEPPDLSEIPILRRDLINGGYFFTNLVQTSRGCPFRCDFCSVSRFNGRRVRNRPLEHILDEISNFKKKKSFFFADFFFADDNITANPSYAERLFKEIKPLNLAWGSQASIDILKNERLLELAVESGCKALFIGFESLSQDSLKEIHKPYRAQEYKELIKKMHDQGIAIEGAFIFGFDHDRKDVFKRTVDFCYDTDLDVAHFTALTPFPGTKLFERFRTEDRITTYNWNNYDAFNVVYKPKNMSAEELREGLRWSYDNFYSLKYSLKQASYLIPKIGLLNSLMLFLIKKEFRRLKV